MCSAPALTLAVGDIRNNCRSRSRRHGRSRLIRRAFRFPSPTTPGATPDPVHGFDLQRDCGPLPASGNPYQIEVQDQGLNDTGTYVAFLQRLTAAAACETTPITCDAPVSAPLSPAVDSDLLRFNVAEGE